MFLKTFQESGDKEMRKQPKDLEDMELIFKLKKTHSGTKERNDKNLLFCN